MASVNVFPRFEIIRLATFDVKTDGSKVVREHSRTLLWAETPEKVVEYLTSNAEDEGQICIIEYGQVNAHDKEWFLDRYAK